ncbi:hypothetical protein, partial [Flavobacterium sp. SaA2.13]|uniref:hypothetical protein n=1 Tax=Flavobacterium sp. SaA2.13 TaxID=2691898 RepID=UPI001CEF6AAA
RKLLTNIFSYFHLVEHKISKRRLIIEIAGIEIVTLRPLEGEVWARIPALVAVVVRSVPVVVGVVDVVGIFSRFGVVVPRMASVTTDFAGHA